MIYKKNTKLIIFPTILLFMIIIGINIYKYYDEENFYQNYYKYNPFLCFDVSTKTVSNMFNKIDNEKIYSEKHLRKRVKEITESSMFAEQVKFNNGYVYIQLNNIIYDKNNIDELLYGSIKTEIKWKKYIDEMHIINEELKKQNDGFSNLYKNTKNPIDKRSLKILRERYYSSINS